MSFLADLPLADGRPRGAVVLVVEPSSKDLGGFSVRRALPSAKRRLVGPFVFFDHMGPARFQAGEGLDVRPHPHIGLATVTYLTEGSILHRDTLGSAQPIRPGDVNWMVAGSGIAHSERSDATERQIERGMEGIQSWVALPRAHEEAAPGFFSPSGRHIAASCRHRRGGDGHCGYRLWRDRAGHGVFADIVRRCGVGGGHGAAVAGRTCGAGRLCAERGDRGRGPGFWPAAAAAVAAWGCGDVTGAGG